MNRPRVTSGIAGRPRTQHCDVANTHVQQRHSSQHTAADGSSTTSVQLRQAACFADAALRRVLEVIDRRRPVAQLHGLLAAGLVDSVLCGQSVHWPGR